jgi:hypothetical protein
MGMSHPIPEGKSYTAEFFGIGHERWYFRQFILVAGIQGGAGMKLVQPDTSHLRFKSEKSFVFNKKFGTF